MNPFQRMLAALMLRLAPGRSVPNGLDPAGLSHDPAVAAAYGADPLVHRRVSARLVRWLAEAGAQAREAAPTLAVRSLLLAGGADSLVDPGGSRAFAERAPAQMLTMHWYEVLRHELFNEREPDRSRVLDDLERWLQGFDAG